MAESRRTCPGCKQPMQLDTCPPAQGADGTVEVTLHNMPLMVCGCGEKRFVAAEFPLEALKAVSAAESAKIPHANSKGLFKKRYLCSDCGAGLPADAGGRHSYSLDITLRDLSPFRVEVATPVYVCASCSCEQIHSEIDLRAALPEAMVQAFKAAGIPPG